MIAPSCSVEESRQTWGTRIRQNWGGVIFLSLAILLIIKTWIDDEVAGFLFALSILPAAAFASAFYFFDEQREPLNVVATYFLLGIVVITPVAYIESLFFEFVPSTSIPLDDRIQVAFIVVATVEEAAKFAVLIVFSRFHKEFDEPVDGIVYGAMVGAGFAAWENVRYVFYPIRDIWDSTLIGILRSATAVPLHVFMGVTMGHLIARAKFSESNGQKFGYTILAFLIPYFVHGAYDAIVFFMDPMGLDLTVLAAILVVLILAIILQLNVMPEYTNNETTSKQQGKSLKDSF